MSEENTLTVIPSQSEIDNILHFGELVVKSGLAPKSFDTKEKVFLAVVYGRELGISGMQSLQGLQVISGKIGISGDLGKALADNHPDSQGITEEWIGEEGTENRGMRITFKRRGKPDVVREWTVKDAKTAHLWGKTGPWADYPKRMMYYRPLGFGLRDQWGDVLKGLKTTEELQDYPDAKETNHANYKPALEANNWAGSSGSEASTRETPEVSGVRRRGRPPGSTNKPKEKEEINETPKIADAQESAPEPSLESEKAPEPVLNIPVDVVFPPLVGQIRQELERIGKTEQRLLSLLNEWRLLKSMATPLHEVEESTLNMVWKRWDTVKKSL
jgi:hypothetical protein